MDIVRRKYNFRGRVQAVGFRYRSYYAAMSLGLSGWVRNEYDDSVTMEVQGTEADIASLISTLQNDHYIRIYEIDVKNIPVDPHEVSFSIR